MSELNQRKGQARGLFEACCEDIKGLTARVEKALEKNAALRCAVPFSDALHCTFPSPAVGGAVVVMAADGSQIVPSRHDRVEFGVINTGIFRMETGGDAANPPTEIINSRLLYGDDLEAHGKPINEDLIALWRDLDERRNLVEMAARETLPVAALTDGPLELYQEPKQQEEFTALFQDYLFEMRKMAS
ncbi:MAG: hypothetical protein IT308_08135, partial [Anaerolineaceae bacterium]|nr:hypothetical protein [Anaerolineaceae bacterium]